MGTVCVAKLIFLIFLICILVNGLDTSICSLDPLNWKQDKLTWGVTRKIIVILKISFNGFTR